jgi:hypothetical protein
MDFNAQKEAFSRAYVKAVAAVAGFATYTPSVDDDSVDLGLAARGGGGTTRAPRLELQLKCTAGLVPVNATFGFELRRKNYDELRPTDVLVPRLLVVVIVPQDVADWVTQTEERLALQRCGYYLSLRGLAATENEASVTLQIPRRQVFSAEALRQMMEQIGNGGAP